MTRPVLRTSICDRLGIEYPIMLAGMGSRGKATPPKLVAAVSEAGGLGMIGGSGLPPEEIRRCIRAVRSMTTKPFGVDLLLPASLAPQASPTRSAVRRELREKFPEHAAFVEGLMREHGLTETPVDNEVVVSAQLIEDQVRVVLEEKVAVFAAGLGDPSIVADRVHAQGMTVMGLVGTVRNAERQVAAGCDMIVAQGHEAGGHTGAIASFALIPQVVDAVAPVPVIAAGAIADGRGVAAALALGASAVWVGTAFLVSEECDIADAHKDQILHGRSQDFQVRRVYSGKTMRSYKNPVIEAWDSSGLDPLPMPYQKVMMDDFNEAARAAGRFDLHSNPAGQIAGMLRERKPAARIMRELVEGTIATLDRLPNTVATTLAAE